MICELCRYDYPSEVPLDKFALAGHATDGKAVITNEVGPICAICALELTNQVYHADHKQFAPGSTPELLRQAALEARRLGRAKPPTNVRRIVES